MSIPRTSNSSKSFSNHILLAFNNKQKEDILDNLVRDILYSKNSWMVIARTPFSIGLLIKGDVGGWLQNNNNHQYKIKNKFLISQADIVQSTNCPISFLWHT